MQQGEPMKLKIKVPEFDNAFLIQSYAKTLIGRCMNPVAQDMNTLLFMMPIIWNVEGRVAGADLGLGKFHFNFDMEEDIIEVLKKEPYHFDHWMLSIVRWEPVVDKAYPSEIKFWVRMMGIPLHFWAEPTFKTIGQALGDVMEVDLDNDRVHVKIDGFKPLIFETLVEFHDGEETSITLRYERLFGFCRKCHSLCHDYYRCPEVIKEVEKKNVNPKDHDRNSKGDDRNMSYKGAAIKSNITGRSRGDQGDTYKSDTNKRTDGETKKKYELAKEHHQARMIKRTMHGLYQASGSQIWQKLKTVQTGSSSSDSNQVAGAEISDPELKVDDAGQKTDEILATNESPQRFERPSMAVVEKEVWEKDEIVDLANGKSARKVLIFDNEDTNQEGTKIEKLISDFQEEDKDLENHDVEDEAMYTIEEDSSFNKDGLLGKIMEEDDTGMLLGNNEEEDENNMGLLIDDVEKDKANVTKKKFTKTNFFLKGASTKKRNALILASPCKTVRYGDGLYSSKAKAGIGKKGGAPTAPTPLI